MNEKYRKYYDQYKRMYEKLVRQQQPIMEKALRKQVKFFTDAWSESQIVTPQVIPAKMLVKPLVRVHVTGGVNGGRLAQRQINREVKEDGVIERWTWVINEYIRENGLENLSIEITNTLRRNILKVLIQANTDGLGVKETVRLLNDSKFPKYMATRIVRTELAKAANVGAMVAATDANIQMDKMWISATDNRTRYIPRDKYDHLFMDGKQVGFSEGFVVPSTQNVESLQFPCDPKGSAGNIINCRCRVAFVPVRDAEGNLIPLRTQTSNPFKRLLDQARALGTQILGFFSSLTKEYENEIEIK